MTPFDPRLSIIARQARVKTCHVYHCYQAIAAMKVNFHMAAFAEFAGLELRHVEGIISALKSNNAMPKPAKQETQRGTRLDANFVIPFEWLNWAISERGWTMDEVKQEAVSFVDYWAGVSGAKGVKADWQATWRNSVRRSHRAGREIAKPSQLSPLEIAERQLRTAIMLGQSYEESEARKKIAELSNVIQLKRA